MSGFSPETFMSKVGQMGGLARKWKYSLEIIPPNSFPQRSMAGDIEFLAMSVLMPRKGFNTTEHKTYGITRSLPYETTYEPILATFMNTNDWKPRVFFDKWLEYIQKPGSLDLEYWKKYTGTIRIYSYNEETANPAPGQQDYAVELLYAWPESISAYGFGWDQSDMANFEVSFRYKEWRQYGAAANQSASTANLAPALEVGNIT